MKLKQKRGLLLFLSAIFSSCFRGEVLRKEKGAKFFFHFLTKKKGTHNESLLIGYILFMIFPYICILENWSTQEKFVPYAHRALRFGVPDSHRTSDRSQDFYICPS